MILLFLLSGCLYDRARFLELSQGFVDDDGDGYREIDGDCDDANPAIHPGVDELCDGIDNDCEGGADLEALDIKVWYQDLDGDGYGNPEIPRYQCEPPNLFADQSGDCDDQDPGVYPDASEACDDSIDRNCDGFAGDDDGDGASRCVDCDTQDATVYPGATEVCDGIDNNCDGAIDNAPADGTTYYYDADGDGYGNPEAAFLLCAPTTGYTLLSWDCDDTNREVYPGIDEVCGNGVDDNCDGERCRLEGALAVATQWSGEADGLVVEPDRDGDGADELVIAASTTEAFTGAAYLLDQQPSGNYDISGRAAMTITGDAPGDYLGQYLALGADVNGDGVDDYALSTTDSEQKGTIHLLSYRAGLSAVSSLEFASLRGEQKSGGLGYGCLQLQRDVTGNGSDELAVASATVGAGQVYLYDHLLTGTVPLSSADTLFVGEKNGDLAGSGCLSTDLDGDGISDWYIGAMGETSNGADAGAVYLVLGTPTGTVSLTDADMKWVGEPGAYLGDLSPEAADVDGDGAQDIVLTSAHDEPRPLAGTILVIPGPFQSGPVTASFTVSGVHPDEFVAAHQLADLDNDGVVDMVVGAQGYTENESNQGAITLFYGPLNGVRTTDLSDGTYNGSAANANAGKLLDVGDLNGDGVIDIVIGESGIGAVDVILGQGF